jgi:hypothetical protein
LEEISEKFMENILDMVNQNVQDALKKFKKPKIKNMRRPRRAAVQRVRWRWVVQKIGASQRVGAAVQSSGLLWGSDGNEDSKMAARGRKQKACFLK